ncbi:MAG: hypothetical protein ACK46D_10365, partial [Roseiflexaceae bacterium]
MQWRTVCIFAGMASVQRSGAIVSADNADTSCFDEKRCACPSSWHDDSVAVSSRRFRNLCMRAPSGDIYQRRAMTAWHRVPR